MIQTLRLALRRVAEGDWRAVQGIWADAARSPYAQYDRPNDLADGAVRRRIAMWASWAGSDIHRFYAVCLGETVIGYIALHRETEGDELGYCFHSAYHGRGYARESLSALLALEARRGVRRVVAGTALDNTPSVRLLAALGFSLVGRESVSFYTDDAGQPICFEGGRFALELSERQEERHG